MTPEKIVEEDSATVKVVVPAPALLSVIVPAVPVKLGMLIKYVLRSSVPPFITRLPVLSAEALPSWSVPAVIVVTPV